MIFSRIEIGEAEGAISAHTIRINGDTVKKGSVLSRDDIACLKSAGIKFIAAVRLEPGDLDENEAALAVARALAGDNLVLGKSMGGRVNLYARANGLAQIDRKRIDAINLGQSSITVATLPEYAEAVAQRAVATVKVIPFAVASAEVDRCLALARTDNQPPAVSLIAYKARRVALILTSAPGLKPSILDSTREVTGARLQTLGCQVDFEARCGHSVEELCPALAKAGDSDCDLILICGATVTCDIGDVVPAAIVGQGGEIIHYGMPVEPGNMLLLARIGDRLIVNLPGCSRSPKLNGLDWVLQRIAAEIPVTARDIQQMGVGGLIKDIPHIRRRRQKVMKNLQPKVAAVILAAGRSQRMGEHNKLLTTVGDLPMVSHVVGAALDSNVQQVVVVTGYEAEQVKQAPLLDRTEIVFNADFASGMASSLRSGLDSVVQDMEGALILLGDMPLISAAQINELIVEFNPAMERDIVVPFKDGKRGNPVLWSKRYFPALRALTGDTGGRVLMQENTGNIWDLPMLDDAIFVDFDTPDSLTHLPGLMGKKR